MQLQFLGAAGTVTGSKSVLRYDGHAIMVDGGLFQGVKHYRERNWANLPIPIAEIEAIVLTHAHLDHSGYVPVLARQGYRGPVYCTPGTRELCAVLWPDAAHLQEEDAAYANRKGFSRHKPAQALFNLIDAQRALDLLHEVEFDQPIPLPGGLQGRFSPAGHIIGAACLSLLWRGQHIVFSGDVGRPQDPIMRPPRPLPDADILVLESTYGDRLHAHEDVAERLSSLIHHTAAHGGKLIIPAFAVGRAQTILYLLCQLRDAGRIPALPIYLNSPMAVKATEIFYRHVDEHRLQASDVEKLRHTVHYVESTQDSIALCGRPGPMIIVSASGMATGGRVLHHLRQALPDPHSSVLFIGFQAPGTRGDLLVRGATTIKLLGADIPVRCHIENMTSLSAHADQQEMLSWLASLPKPPRLTLINHGEPTASDALRTCLQRQLGYQARVAEHLQSVDLQAYLAAE